MPPNPLEIIKQLMIPGMRKLTGAERIPGKPGMWAVDPSKLSETQWLKRAEKTTQKEMDLAERGPSGVPRVSGVDNARSAGMLLGALNELRYANEMAKMAGKDPGVRGIVHVNPSGKVTAGAAINKKKSAEYLADPDNLDFTASYPNYLEYVSTMTPEARGSDIQRELQKLHGNEMVFQVANPKKNAPIYEAMGAQRMPLLPSGDDILDGGPGLPAFQFFRRIPERGPRGTTVGDLEKAGQMRLEGFRKGGLARYQQGGPVEQDARYTQLVEALNNPALSNEDRMLILQELEHLQQPSESQEKSTLEQLLDVLKEH